MDYTQDGAWKIATSQAMSEELDDLYVNDGCQSCDAMREILIAYVQYVAAK